MRWENLALFICVAVLALLSIHSKAVETPPAAMLYLDKPKPVKAVLLKSWGVGSVWADLKINWNRYGKTPLVIDDTTLVNGDFTYQDLVNSKANVLILSNPAGGNQLYTPSEVSAVSSYAAKGHSVIGTFEVFQSSKTDNRALAPLFGLKSGLQYTQAEISNLFHKLKAAECIFARISGNSWQSYGYHYSQIPLGGSWLNKLGQAQAVAQSDNYVGAISLYKAKKYTGIYISNFPEYYGGTNDEQLLYNASICYVR